ncbi:MAG: hypothetical protein ACYTFI_01805 [Planctomycetota bacterium]|jgi:hypothetical protein
MNRRLGASLLATLLLAPLQARALEILSDSERAERERQRKLRAKPVLSCKPASLSTKAKRGDTAELSITIRNTGGRTLRWSLGKLPRWLAADVTTGELKHAEEKRVVLHVRTRLVSGGGDESGITIVAPGADGSPFTVPIAVAVEEPPPPKPVARGIEPEPIRLPPEPGGGVRGKVGARVGFMLPGSGSTTEYDSSAFLGLQYRVLQSDSSKLSLELGVDYASSDADAADSSSTLTSGRADILLYMGGGGLYLLSGLGGLFENSDVSGSGRAGLLDVGAGLTLVDGKFDVRVTHAVLLGGENVSGMTLLSAAYCF